MSPVPILKNLDSLPYHEGTTHWQVFKACTSAQAGPSHDPRPAPEADTVAGLPSLASCCAPHGQHRHLYFRGLPSGHRSGLAHICPVRHTAQFLGTVLRPPFLSPPRTPQQRAKVYLPSTDFSHPCPASSPSLSCFPAHLTVSGEHFLNEELATNPCLGASGEPHCQHPLGGLAHLAPSVLLHPIKLAATLTENTLLSPFLQDTQRSNEVL